MKAVQDEIDGVLGNRFTTPFDPVPSKINTLTFKLAAYTLKQDACGHVASARALEALHKQLAELASGDTAIIDDEGVNLSSATCSVARSSSTDLGAIGTRQ